MRRITTALAGITALSLALGACASSKATGLPAGPTTPPVGKVCATIDMTDTLKFVPEECTAKVGQKVTWENVGSAAHTVTSEDIETFDSGNISGGGTYEFTFETAGDYPYWCRLHAVQGSRIGMIGTITVEA